MNLKILTTASAAALLFAGAAMAQTAPAPAEDHSAHAGHGAAEASAQAQASAFTDAELLTFAQVIGQLRQIAGDSAANATPEQQAQMAAVVQGSGLNIQRFNEISVAVSADTALQGRIVSLLQARQAGASGSAGAE